MKSFQIKRTAKPKQSKQRTLDLMAAAHKLICHKYSTSKTHALLRYESLFCCRRHHTQTMAKHESAWPFSRDQTERNKARPLDRAYLMTIWHHERKAYGGYKLRYELPSLVMRKSHHNSHFLIAVPHIIIVIREWTKH